MQTVYLKSVKELLSLSKPWDELWRASDVATPTARAEHLALWLKHFAPRASLHCIVIREGERLLAALPLVQKRIKGLLAVGGAVANFWSAAGQLLVDPAAPVAAMDLLVAGLQRSPWPLVWLEGVDPSLPGWRQMVTACQRAGLPHDFRRDCEVGLIDVQGDWREYQSRLHTHHARNLAKARRRLENLGSVRFEHYLGGEPTVAARLWDEALAIEERSWKAGQGTTITADAAARSFFQQQAALFATWNMLELSVLWVNDKPIAFQYGYRGKGVYLAHKSGFDEAYAAFSPGQLLMCELLRSLHDDPEIHTVDCLGPINHAVSRWATRTYPEGRLMIASAGWLGRMAWPALQAVWDRRESQRLPEAPIGKTSEEELVPT